MGRTLRFSRGRTGFFFADISTMAIICLTVTVMGHAPNLPVVDARGGLDTMCRDTSVAQKTGALPIARKSAMNHSLLPKPAQIPLCPLASHSSRAHNEHDFETLAWHQQKHSRRTGYMSLVFVLHEPQLGLQCNYVSKACSTL